MKRVLPLFLLLASCGDQRPPAPTAEENRLLDEAGNMLDEESANAATNDAASPD